MTGDPSVLRHSITAPGFDQPSGGGGTIEYPRSAFRFDTGGGSPRPENRLGAKTAPAAERRSYFEALIESDRRYFAAGATEILVPNITVTCSKKASNVSAAICAHLTGDAADISYDGLLAELERVFLTLGSDRPRLYVTSPTPQMIGVARDRGYAVSTEAALILDRPIVHTGRVTPDLTLTPVASPADWQDKLAFHFRNPDLPDGRGGEPRDWMDFERLKARAGYMVPFIARRNEDAIAVVSLSDARGFLRLKNLVVDRDHRNEGVTSGILAWAQSVAESRGLPAIGLFANCGGPAERVYRHRGFVEVGRITEFHRVAQADRGAPTISGDPETGR